MAVIGKIQKRSGLIFAIVLIALAAFVLGDLLTGKGGGNKGLYLPIAAVDGEKIPQREFFAKVEKQLDMQKQQTGQENISNTEVFQIKQQVYNTMLRDILLGKQYEKLGLALPEIKGAVPSISRDELLDLIYGNNPHTFIVQNFRDPQTGEFNPALVKNFLNYIRQTKEGDDQDQLEQVLMQEKQWENLVEYIKSDRLSTKYNTLIKKAYYVPKPLAKFNYELRNKTANVRYYAVRYNTIPDSAAVLTDADYQKYYDEHKLMSERRNETRELDYVFFEVLPSEADIKAIEERVNETVNLFTGIEIADIPAFVNRFSGSGYDSTFIKRGTLSFMLDSLMFSQDVGYTYGPYFEDNAYHITRLVDRQTRSDSLKASHILIAYQGSARAEESTTRSKVQAQKTADSLFAVIKANPSRFEEIASVINDDPTAKTKQGDLDWFNDGLMAYDFNEFCAKGKIGEMGVVETVFGYHIIKVTGKTEPLQKIRMAQVNFALEPSQETYDEYWKKSSKFVGEVRNKEDFERVINEQGLNKRSASLEIMSYDIPGLENPRELVMWAFSSETNEGDVSTKVFEFGNKYVIGLVREVRAKGIPSVEEVKEEIEILVRRDKKAEMITKQLQDAFTAGKNFYSIASQFNVNVDTLDFLRFDFGTLRSYGPEPYVIGKMFAAKPGETSKPLKGEQGIFVFILDEIKEPEPTEDHSMLIMQMKSMFEGRVDGEVYNALERRAKIEDNRILFF